MGEKHDKQCRRNFLKTTATAVLASTLPANLAQASSFQNEMLQVWSCGGLAEAFRPANELYEQKTGVRIGYTGAFAAALGKSLLGGAQTEVFAGRVLKLAHKLRSEDKMLYFKPLCFTSYVIITPKGNPAGINTVQDLARSGVRVVLAPDASPPGGPAVLKLLEKAGVKEAALSNAVVMGSCVQRIVEQVVSGNGDVAIVENRITRLKSCAGQVEVIQIPDEFYPPPPLTFTIGVMKFAKNRELADDYVNFITSETGQACFEHAGFIPAISEKGRILTEKLGVKDV
jgi:molybdate transport system substrate-binding protein